MATKYDKSWLVTISDHDETGILVKHHNYWWFLCPATATLYLSDAAIVGDGCSFGADCEWDDLHDAAALLWQTEVGGE